MTPHPDTPEFTAAVLGEEISDLKPQISNPAARREAAEIRAAAARLSAALRSQPALTLSTAARQAVLRRPAARPTWFWPTAAAAAFAALLGGAALWMPVRGVDGATRGTGRVPTVGIKTAPSAGPAAPSLPPGPLARDKKAPVLPAGSWVTSPPEPPVTVGGSAPDLKSPAAPAVPDPTPPAPAPLQRSFASPAR